MRSDDGRENLFTGANHVLNIDGEFNELKLVGDVRKAPGLDDQPEMWEDGTEHLTTCLRAIKTNNRKFGMIAIEK